MTGTATITVDANTQPIKKLTVSWTCTAGGVVSVDLPKISGELIKGVTDPTDGPTDNYDITLSDPAGADVLGNSYANLQNRDTTNTETAYFNLTDGAAPIAAYPAVCDVLTLAIANAGASKSGVIYLYVKGYIG